MTKKEALPFVGKLVRVYLVSFVFPQDGTQLTKDDLLHTIEKYGDVWKLWAVGGAMDGFIYGERKSHYI